jgi:hypothetical protein
MSFVGGWRKSFFDGRQWGWREERSRLPPERFCPLPLQQFCSIHSTHYHHKVGYLGTNGYFLDKKWLGHWFLAWLKSIILSHINSV